MGYFFNKHWYTVTFYRHWKQNTLTHAHSERKRAKRWHQTKIDNTVLRKRYICSLFLLRSFFTDILKVNTGPRLGSSSFCLKLAAVFNGWCSESVEPQHRVTMGAGYGNFFFIQAVICLLSSWKCGLVFFAQRHYRNTLADLTAMGNMVISAPLARLGPNVYGGSQEGTHM